LTGWTTTGIPAVGGSAWTTAIGVAEAKPGAGSTSGNSIIERTISTSGFDTIVVSYDRRLVDFDAEEEFVLAWSVDGTAYTVLEETLATTPNDVAMVPKTFNLPATVANNAGFRIRVTCTSNAQTDFCQLDNILVSGTALPVTPKEITACNAVGNPGNLDVRKIDFTNNGLSFDGKTFGKDDEWFSLENIEVQIEIKNNGNDNVDDVEVSWGLYDTKTNKWVIDYDNEDEFNLKDGDKELVTVSFKLDDDLDVDLEDLSDGNNYKFYVTASGTVDNATALSTCVSDFEQASVVIESDFVVLDNFQVPETAQCGATVEVSADAWNIGDSDQDAVSVQATNSELKLNEEILVGDMNAFDNQKVSLTFKVPNDAAEKTYPIKFEVLDEDGDVYQNNYDDDYAEFTVPLTVKGSCSGSVAPVTVTANLVSGGKAGQDMVIKSTVTNTGTASATYTLSSSGHGQWASTYTVAPASLTLTAGQSGEATFTFNVNKDAFGDQTFYIELVSGNQVTRQPVSVVVAKAGFFDSITGGAVSGSSGMLWGLGILNVVLIIVIILVAMRVTRK
ncbi:MAG: putative S-layer protein, partial [Nanoarchaeota archaeon]